MGLGKRRGVPRSYVPGLESKSIPRKHSFIHSTEQAIEELERALRKAAEIGKLSEALGFIIRYPQNPMLFNIY